MPRTKACCAKATATDTITRTRPMPAAYATYTATPDTTLFCLNVVETVARKAGMVHDSETTAYEIPYTNMDHAELPRRARPGFESAGRCSSPASMVPPKAASTRPITIVARGVQSAMVSDARC